ncbi:DedA family protein [Terribacillus sp. 179-K 1B1 HS]|uniref:DedA family protein n=1 Tax=Terribacillus sp. 179-K 1B1 HS TaxID=3142388 RepID=UPI0039A211B6
MEQLGNLIENYGYIGIFIALVLGIVGLPIPDEILLTYVGYNIFIERMTWSGSIFAAMVGSIFGISISYILGIKLGLPFLQRFGPKMHITENRIKVTAKYFSKYGGWLLMFGYFIPGIRHITAYMAGISNYRFGKFAFFAYIGAAVWVNTFIILGLILGKKWEIVEGVLHQSGKVLILLACIGLISYLIIRFRKKLTK